MINDGQALISFMTHMTNVGPGVHRLGPWCRWGGTLGDEQCGPWCRWGGTLGDNEQCGPW